MGPRSIALGLILAAAGLAVACRSIPEHPANLDGVVTPPVGGGTPPGDSGTDAAAATTFATVPNARGLFLGGGYLYVSSIGDGGATGLVVRAPIGGGTAETLIENAAEPWAVVANDERVIFSTAASGTGAGSIYGFLLAGTTIDTLTASVTGAYGLALDGTTAVYYTESSTTLGVERRSLTTAAVDRIVTSNVLATGNALAIAGQDLFVVASNGNAYRAPVLGGVLEALDLPLAGALVDLALDDTTVYAALDLPAPNGAIVAYPKLGGAVRTVLSGLDHPGRIVVQDSRVYYTEPAAGNVGWVATTGGNPVALATGLDGPYALAVGDGVYVGTKTAVLRLPK